MIRILPAAVILHGAALASTWKRGRSRSFWVGFLSAGAAVMATNIKAIIRPYSLGVDFPGETLFGEIFSPSLAARWWNAYAEFCYDQLDRVCTFLLRDGGINPILLIVPVIGAGTCGGLLLRWVMEWRRKLAKDRAAPEADSE